MKPFLFRAQAALDIRRAQEEAAQRALALAEADVRRAEDVTRAAFAAMSAAGTRACGAFDGGCTIAELLWHRNWMMGLEQDVERARAREHERRTAAQQAALRAQDARRALRTLERLRERAWLAWQAVARREEQKALDLLGSLQHAVRQTQREELDT